jgi:hypothetical protein
MEDPMWFKISRNEAESKLAIREAKKGLAHAKSRNEEVREVTETIRYYRARNHFGERVDAIVQGKIERGN